MNPLEKRWIGNTKLSVTCLGLGCLELEERSILDRCTSVSAEQAIATVEKALDLGINYMDTAPRYGNGRSESLLGRVLSQRKREHFVLSTKVGRILQPMHPQGWIWDFSRHGVLQSLTSSLQRLGLDHVDILFIRSPDNHYTEAMTEAYPQLAELRAQGIVKAIGVGITQWQLALRFAQEGDFDCILLASRPAMTVDGHLTPLFGGLIGIGSGAGMALMFFLTGLLGILVGISGYFIPTVRNIEDLLPDYQAETHDMPGEI